MFDFFNRPREIPKEELSRIDDKIQDLYAKIRNYEPFPEMLYHYTNERGFLGIIESGILRATHISFMNDASEYVHAVNILLQLVEKRTDRSPAKNGCVST